MGVLESWIAEKQSAYLYLAVAEAERDPSRRKMFLALAEAAERQAAVWAEEASRGGPALPARSEPSPRARFVARMVRRLGPARIRPVLAAMKVRGLSTYSKAPLSHDMPASVEEVGRRHRGVGGQSLRAAVFGVNDGLVSNASLILGVSGAAGDSAAVLIAGAAGLLAGALSMAAGEYISVKTQREMFEHQISEERDELAEYPAEEAAELALIYEARGLSREDARRFATQLVADPARALDTLAREELGLDPGGLGSPLGAALASFLSFALGALVPLAPFLIFGPAAALPAAIAITALALFSVGAAISLFTGGRALFSGARMLAIGSGAGAATFLIGRLFSAAVY
jgi:vacuolar iron transporter family protein